MSVPEKVQRAWNNLQEKDRKFFCTKIQRHEPKLFKDWCNLAGMADGYRIQKIGTRQTGANQLDKALFETGDGFFAEVLFKKFFCEIEPNLNKNFLTLAGENRKGIVKNLSLILSKIRRENSLDPFIDLYIASSEWMASDWKDENQEEFDEESSSTVEVSQLETIFQQLATQVNEVVKEPLEKLSLGIKTNIENLIENLNKISVMGEELRHKVEQASENAGVLFKPWENAEEFQNQISLINNQLATRTSEIIEFYCSLENLLSSSKILHKSQAIRSKWEKQKEAACGQLKKVISDGPVTDFPRCTELNSTDWFEWIMSLTDASLDEIVEIVSVSLPSLGQLLCEIERHQIEFLNIGQKVTNNFANSDSPTTTLDQQESTDAAEVLSENNFDRPVISDIVISSEDNQEKIIPCTEVVVESLKVNEKFENPLEENLIHDTEPAIESVLEVQMFKSPPAAQMAPSSTESINHPDLLWKLLKDKQFSLAYHISLCMEKQGIDTITRVPSEIIKGIILSPFLSSQHGALTEIARECNNNISTILSNEQNSGHNSVGLNLLAFGLSLRPTLLASQTHFNELLLSLKANSDFPALEELKKAIINYTHIGIDLNPTILKGMREHVAWEQNLNSHIERCRLARETNRHSSIIYAPTTNVWRAWQDPDHPLGAILDIIINNRRDKVADVTSGIKQWSNQNYIREQVDRTDHDLRGRNAKLRPIEARAPKVIVSRTLELLELAKEWLDIIKNESMGFSDKDQIRAESCRIDLLKHLDNAKEQVDRFLEKQPNVMLQGALTCLRLALVDLHNLFDPLFSHAATQTPFEYLLHNSLLFITPVEFDEQWQPLDCSQQKLMDELAKQVQIIPDLRSVIDEHYRNGNLYSWKRLINYFRHTDAFEKNTIESIEDEYDKAEETFRGRLVVQIKTVQKESLKALHYNIITSQDYEQFRSSIDTLNTGEILLYMHSEHVIARIIERIKESKQKRIQIVKDSLRKEKDLCRKYPEACLKIEENLEKGDFSIAEEYLSLLKKGREIPQSTDREDIFCSFFPTIADSTYNYLKDKRKLPDIKTILRENVVLDSIESTSLTESDIESSDQLLKSWEQLKARGGDFTALLKNVITGLGFEVERDGLTVPKEFRFRGDRKDRFCWVEVKTKIVEGREKCPIPSYASQAKGRYQFLCCWGLGSESEIFDQYRNRIKPQPTFILSFARATNQQRRELAKICHEKKPRRSQIFIDEILTVHSACQPKYKRLNTLFECALPFTIAEPYKTTAGHVPQEMFYGRQKAREEILKSTGTNLVFGGRQLGKTALLRDVADREHNPAAGSIVRWIDLKTEHIGFTRKAKEIWSVITEKLYEDGIFVSAQASRPDTVKKNILKWLNEDEGRRILLLLDEADAFLKFDREDKDGQFANLLHLKGLMEESGRRFKVVFAGLHNVQRTARDINTPLAHLGSPICIGPLLDDREIDEAINLIRVPFEALGYRFESDDLIWTILWHTISYPSLIQLFCKHLLEYMIDRNRDQINTKKAPPYTIQAQHLDNVFQEKGLRDAILEKFRLTLDLDQRYKLIALIIASECTKNIEKGAPIQEEFDVAWVRKEALLLWPQGFKDDQSHEAFRTILEEMIGLGILRRADGNKFSLRNLGVVKLLGTELEIENELFDIMELDGPVEYNEVLTFRRILNGRSLSPLTFSQENDIFLAENGVVVLFGSRIAGFERIEEFLVDACKKQKFEYIKLRENELSSCKSQIDKILIAGNKHNDDTARLIVFGKDVPWNEKWVEEIIKSDFLKRKKRITRILFLGDSNSCWSWSNSADHETMKELEKAGLITISLRPFTKDAIKLCLESMNLAIGIEQSFESIQNVTGNWLNPLQRFVDRIEDNGERWRDNLSKFSTELTSQCLIDLFDITPEALPIFKELAESTDEVTVEDLSILTGIDENTLEGTLSWAEKINLVSQAKEKWGLDPLCLKVLQDEGLLKC